MGKGAIWLGTAIILFGIWLSFKIISKGEPLFVLIYSLFAIGIGIALIIFYKEESKIEERKDLKSKKTK